MIELINKITKELNVTPQQSEGGLGALFAYAQQNINKDDFMKLAGFLPGLSEVISKAPQASSTNSQLSNVADSLLSSFGIKTSATDSILGFAQIAGQFKSLGLNQEMISKFLPLVLDFANSKSNGIAKDILAKVLKP